jgi:hypothetical protein
MTCDCARRTYTDLKRTFPVILVIDAKITIIDGAAGARPLAYYEPLYHIQQSGVQGLRERQSRRITSPAACQISLRLVLKSQHHTREIHAKQQHRIYQVMGSWGEVRACGHKTRIFSATFGHRVASLSRITYSRLE